MIANSYNLALVMLVTVEHNIFIGKFEQNTLLTWEMRLHVFKVGLKQLIRHWTRPVNVIHAHFQCSCRKLASGGES